MATEPKRTASKTTAAAAVIGCCVAFTPLWEGYQPVAAPDAIGTGHTVTYCYGQTDEFGAVKVGQRFNRQECAAKLAESLPKYLDQVEPCVHVALPIKTMAALVDAAYNAGPAAVCRSPMVAKMNAGDLAGGCNAFSGWHIRGDGKVLPGLIARRGGRPGDARKSERALCLEGVAEGLPPPPAPAPEPKGFWADLISTLLETLLNLLEGK